LNLKEKISTLSNAQALDLLANNGNLIKRPFLISKSKTLVGFQPETWKKSLN
ncbi:MAG: ArsC/Spx/MgsR family protein, partial [bacterium]